MKYILISFLILIITSVSFSQEIPNNSFETWTEASAGHEDPDYWSTANSTTNVFPIYKITTTKTEDAYDGSYAAMLSSQTVLTFVAPGFVTLGDFSIDLWTQVTSITGGIEYTMRPSKLKVWYKYTPAETDNMRIGMWMLRNEGFEVPDTVATALYESGASINEYTQIEIDVEYRNEFNPEILNIIAVSSNPDGPVAGSVLYIDKFELEYSTGIIQESQSVLNVFPNPVTDYILMPEYFSGSNFTITNMGGQIVYKGFYIAENPILISDFSSGIYVLNVEKNGIIHSQKFIK
ncbi:MAG: PCMD domain-containing protein [Bacteroidales bacterium]|jgi:hypothetical protein|nr:PCMD domain-containing protein [Bacteroidales bacterium]